MVSDDDSLDFDITISTSRYAVEVSMNMESLIEEVAEGQDSAMTTTFAITRPKLNLKETTRLKHEQLLNTHSYYAIECDNSVEYCNSRPSLAQPTTPPPTSRKSTWVARLQNRLAFCALCVFVLLIVVTVVLLIANIKTHKK